MVWKREGRGGVRKWLFDRSRRTDGVFCCTLLGSLGKIRLARELQTGGAEEFSYPYS